MTTKDIEFTLIKNPYVYEDNGTTWEFFKVNVIANAKDGRTYKHYKEYRGYRSVEQGLELIIEILKKGTINLEYWEEITDHKSVDSSFRVDFKN